MSNHAKSNIESPHLHQAVELLESVKDNVMTDKQREEAAVKLGAYILDEANRIQTHSERKKQSQLARMMKDPRGKAFTRQINVFAAFDLPGLPIKLVYLLHVFGIPKYMASNTLHKQD